MKTALKYITLTLGASVSNWLLSKEAYSVFLHQSSACV